MTKKKPNKISTSRRTALVELAAALGDKRLVAEVTLAADDPEAYLEKFRERMDDINVDEPRDDLAWLALTEGLSARERLVELDWKHEADDALGWIERLAGAAGRKLLKPLREDPELEERYTDEALELFGQTLAPAKLALVELDKSSDSFPMMVVAAARVPDLVKLAKRAGGAIVPFVGKHLAARQKERTRAEAQEAAQRTSTNRWTQLASTTWQNNSDGVLWKLRHHPYPVEEIRAAMPDAPKRDRPLIAMVLALHDRPATKVARATNDLALCLKALNYVGQEERLAGERLGATAIVAERLKLAPGNGKQHLAIGEACNLFGDDKEVDRALAKLPAATRDRLARLADGLLQGAPFQSDRWFTACRALRTVGDEKSLPVIEAGRLKIPEKWRADPYEKLDDAIARIRKRAERKR